MHQIDTDDAQPIKQISPYKMKLLKKELDKLELGVGIPSTSLWVCWSNSQMLHRDSVLMADQKCA